MAGIVASGAGSVIYARHEQDSFEPEIGIQKGYEKRFFYVIVNLMPHT